MQEELAKVESYFLGIEDHGILAFGITFNYGGTIQGTGMYGLDVHREEGDTRIGTVFGTTLIRRVLDLYKVRKLGDIVGRTTIVLRDGGFNGTIRGLKMPKFEGGKTLMFSDIEVE